METPETPYPAAETACADKDCDRPAWLSCPEGFCLFHSPYNGRLDAAARIVWETARGMAQAGDCDFGRWHFPPDPDLDFAKRQGGFFGATFMGRAGFGGAHFEGDAWFEGAHFEGNTGFGDARFEGVAHFTCAHFECPVRFVGAHFERYASFAEALFEGTAQFDAHFEVEAYFTGTHFEGTIDFSGTRFEGDIRFLDAQFDGGAGFNRAIFGPGCSILLDSPSRCRPFRLRRAGESAYRFAKQAAQARGDYTEAGRYHYAEQRAIEDRLLHQPGVGSWFHGLARLLFGRIVFGYGERPWHPLLLGLAVILAWTGLYLHLDAIGPDNPLDPAAVESHEPSVAEALYFSVVTFTTLGYGDFQPKARYRVLASVEAVLGAALLATFVVCLTRKYMR